MNNAESKTEGAGMTDDLVKQLRDRDSYAKTHGWDNLVFGQAAIKREFGDSFS